MSSHVALDPPETVAPGPWPAAPLTRCPDADVPARPVPAPVSWWTGYLTLLRWSLAQTGAMLPVVVIVQSLLAVGVVVGFGLLIPGLDRPTAEYLATGAPTVLILTVGLVMVPQSVATARLKGLFAFQRSLPIARPLLLAADLTMWFVVAVPSVAVAVCLGAYHYDFALRIDWPLLLGTILLTVVASSAVGYAVAVLIQPMVAQVVSQVLMFFVMLFSPITFPADRLPEWFQSLHAVLPIQAAGDAVRAALLADQYSVSVQSVMVLSAWCILGLLVALRAITRRA